MRTVSPLRELIITARASIENLNPADVAREVEDGDILVVDVRELEEAAAGVIPTAVITPRGTLDLARASWARTFTTASTPAAEPAGHERRLDLTRTHRRPDRGHLTTR
ncbi:rhodanese-like domain-containing protein [Amycolatopsis alkalitolerans]|uniref:Rhodanese domain-containing protein n=1 Tax=Amycolatopsis alkalitolerans TaxID=2547244 RepID=A0A5C4LYC0_9PSEU|nr:hypothetical protein [Amycolatopsis alkalitolerans]TNC23683.1 hypothetical protein FG385_20125 [Amycolatopsis alkalitolerans]